MQHSKHDTALRYGGALFLLLFAVIAIGATSLAENFTKKRDREELNWAERIIFASSFLENWFYDLRNARFYQHDGKSPNLVILNIDDETLNTVGRWPWTRTRHAKILDHLAQYGARVVLFDVVFPEPESPEADGAFAQSIQNFVASGAKRAVVLGYDLTLHDDEAVENLPPELLMSVLTGREVRSEGMIGQRWINRFNFAAPALVQYDTNFGFISADSDPDGVFRHAKLLAELEGKNGGEKGFFPSLGLAGFQLFFTDKEKNRGIEILGNPDTFDYILRVKNGETNRDFLLSAKGEMKVRFFGTRPNFTTVKAEEVLNDANPAGNEKLRGIFRDKVVLLGSSAFGAHDLRHLPVDAQSPGMYMHANLFHALDQNYVFQTDYLSVLHSMLLCVLGGLAVLLFSRLHNPALEAAGAFGLAGGLYAADYFYFSPNGYFLRLFFALFAVVAPHAWLTFLNVFKEAQEKKKIRDAFSRYVAPEVVKEMLSNPDKLKVGGEKREITMLFSDVRDFTTISERLTPQELSTLLNIYMGRMTDILFETGGTLDKYIGDAMVGFWGAPLESKDHAYQAVRGAKLMLDALPEINKEFERRKFPRINVGIGLNTGGVSVGNMGSDRIFQYTALGDNMNLASRLEGLTKYYGVNLMISEFTWEKLGERRTEFHIRPLDLVQVKGKSKAVKIYEVIPNWNPLAKEDGLLAKFCDAYESKYLRRRFEEALSVFREILALYPEDKATKKLHDNAEEYLRNPPPDEWDGVTVMTSK